MATQWLSLKEGAAYLGVSIMTFRRMVDAGLEVRKFGRIVRTCPEWVDSFIVNQDADHKEREAGKTEVQRILEGTR